MAESEPDDIITDNVVDFAEASKGVKDKDDDSHPLVIKRDTWREKCQHKKRRINGTLRRVECRLCNEILDPVQVLMEIAGECSEWEVVRLKKRVSELEYIERMMAFEGRRELMSDEERKMTDAQIIKHHADNGHPPEKMKLTRTMMECYCGLSLSRVSYAHVEAQVLEAQNRQRRKLKMGQLSPAKG